MLPALAACLAATDSIVALYDAADVLRYANASYERHFLRGRALPIGFPDVLRHGFANEFGVRVTSGDIEGFLADISTRRRSAPFRAFAVDTVEGEWIWMTETLVDGWLLSIGSVITQLKEHERVLQHDRDRARHAAETDALTRVCNRGRIVELAHATVASCRQTGAPCSVVLVDLDHFKAINDTFGHLAGDRLLVQFAAHCSGELRPSDRFGRYGGEEFMLVLAETTGADAVRVVDRIRQRLLPATSVNPSGPQPYTFSAGVAEDDRSEDLTTLLQRADLALYRAKASGRNCTR